MNRVLFVIDHLDTGGAPIVVRDLICGLVDQGASVTLVVLSQRMSHELPAEAALVTLPFQPRNRYERWRRYACHARRLDSWLMESGLADFDLVVAHLHHAHQVVRRSRLADQAWYCLHADPVTGFLGNKRGLSRKVKQRKVASLYDGRKVIGVSQGLLDRLMGTFGITPAAAVCLHNPLNLATIRERARDPVCDVPADYLLFVGRLDQRAKRFDRLLAGYRDSGVALPLLLVGEGDGREQIHEWIDTMGLQEKVTLLGHRSNPYPYMRGACALLLSSDYEGFSLVLAEALACGTPVVSTDCPSGPAEILTGELATCLVPLGDAQGYADAIHRVVTKPPLITDDVLEPFRLERVARRYLALADGAKNQILSH